MSYHRYPLRMRYHLSSFYSNTRLLWYNVEVVASVLSAYYHFQWKLQVLINIIKFLGSHVAKSE